MSPQPRYWRRVAEEARDEKVCSPLVTTDPKVTFYAAAPILTDEGYALGVVCIVDRVPRRLSESELAVLHIIGAVSSRAAGDKKATD